MSASVNTNPFEGLISAIAEETARRVMAILRSSPAPEPDARAYSVRQAAAYIGRDEQAIRKLIRQGRLPSVRIDGRVQVDRVDLDHLIDSAKG